MLPVRVTTVVFLNDSGLRLIYASASDTDQAKKLLRVSFDDVATDKHDMIRQVELKWREIRMKLLSKQARPPLIVTLE